VRVLHIVPSLDQRSGGPLRAVLQIAFFAHFYGLDSEVVGVGDVDVPDNPFSPLTDRSRSYLCKLIGENYLRIFHR